MATDARNTTKPVVAEPPGPARYEQGVYARLRQTGYRFNFFQAVRLLERAFDGAPSPGTTASLRNERIHFQPDVALVFPATDVKRVEWEDAPNGPVHVTATFMGLYGIDSPLPYYFYDALASEVEETLPHRAFLDIFNHRLYAFFYQAWKKYRPLLHDEAAQSRRFLSLAGLGTPHVQQDLPLPPMRLAALAGWLAPRTRSAEGLRAVVEQLFGLAANVIENVPRWVTIRSRPTLGHGEAARLGETTTIGERVYDRSGKFRIRLGPMGLDDFLDLLPGGRQARTLRRVVRLYAPDYLDFDVELQLCADEMPRTRLGDAAAKLGLTTSLGRPTDDIVARTVRYAA